MNIMLGDLVDYVDVRNQVGKPNTDNALDMSVRFITSIKTDTKVIIII